MNFYHYRILDNRIINISRLLISFALIFNLQFGHCQTENTAKIQIEELVKNNTERLGNTSIDSIKLYKDLLKAKNVLERQETNDLLAKSYQNLALWHSKNISIDSVVFYYNKAASSFNKIESATQEAEMYLLLEDVYKQRGDYSSAMTNDFKALKIFEDSKDNSGIAKVYTRLCDILYYQQEHKKGADYCQKAIDIQTKLNQPDELALSYRYKADNLLILKEYEEALSNINQAIDVLKASNRSSNVLAPNYNSRGNIYKFLERYDDAITEYERCYEIAKATNNTRGMIPALGNIGHVYRLKGEYEKALQYILEAIQIIKQSGNIQNLAENYMHASSSFKALGNFEKALEYEMLFSDEKIKTLNSTIDQLESELQIKYETEKKDETIENQEARLERQSKIQQLYFGIAFLLVIILIGMFYTIYNNKKKRTALLELNQKIQKKQTELEKSNSQLKSSLEELKTTQEQLIQSEKMASLGELTAGIAHEIQNPLNFVNNFSEVSTELLEEMKEEIENGDFEEVKAIVNDVIQNLEKINHHGQRADGIVKGMLQHSRSGGDKKEPTDINALADEYLRLAYHGLRAKDKSFNAKLVTDFDESIKSIDVVPQDIGRVILNLVTNAFYACTERSRSAVNEKKATADNDYKPMVSVATEKTQNQLKISVTDNGNGIPEQVKEKIFQPFFTTKPTGKGTGLGLSMSYDIITKGHGGEFNVETEEGKGTKFTIHLPILK